MLRRYKMTIKEAEDFMRELQIKLLDETIDIYAEENDKYLSGLFEIIGFALKNLLPDNEIDSNKNKCMIECPFYTVENRYVCSELCPENNCYQCVVKKYQMYESSYRVLQNEVDKLRNENNRIPFLEDEIIRLKAKLYDEQIEITE